MRALLLAFVLGAGSLGAQAPQFPTAPVAPENASPRGSRGEFRITAFMAPSKRSYEFLNNVNTATGSLRGVEVLLRHTAIGIGVRSWSADHEGQPNVASADARVYLFPPAFSIMLGAGRRALWSDATAESPVQLDFVLLGVNSTATIGGSGLRTNISAALMVVAPREGASVTEDKPSRGFEAEASVLYKIPKVPMFVQLGYRKEIFTDYRPTVTVPEEAGGIRLGTGIQFGGR